MGCVAAGCSQPCFWEPSPSPATLHEFLQLRVVRSGSAARAGLWGAVYGCIHYPEGHQRHHTARRAPQGWPLAPTDPCPAGLGAASPGALGKGAGMPRQYSQKSGQQSETVRLQKRSQ